MSTFLKNEEYVFEIIHDIKAPIMSINLALQDIKRDELLNEIYEINKHNLNYIENLMLGYSIKKGKYCPRFELINIVQIIKEELNVLRFLIEEKSLRVSLSIDKVSKTYITCDKTLLRQIILNLLTNAVKFTPKNNQIKIIFQRIGEYIEICFSNPRNIYSYDICSTKMGLDIVKKKIKAIGGKFKITKKIDSICFTMLFPSR